MDATPAIDAFLAQWELEDIPTCDDGMLLLKVFEKQAPPLYVRAAEVDFIDLPNTRDFYGNPH